MRFGKILDVDYAPVIGASVVLYPDMSFPICIRRTLACQRSMPMYTVR